MDRLGYGENTLFLYIWGDNGSSAEGQDGTIAELLAQNGIPTTPRMHIDALEQLGGLDVLGSPKTDNQYHSGWGWAGSTPYKGVKLVASHLGGTRNPLAIRWPKKVAPDPVPRDHFLHVNDVVPTIYDIVGIEPPLIVNGVPQIPIAGASFARTLTDPSAPGGKKTQYFEVMGSRGIYHDGWMASTFGPRVPWLPGLPPGIQDWTPDNDRWELYHLDEDWSQAHDLAAEMPEKLAQMRELFAIEAARNSVLPIGGGLWVPIFHPELRITPPYREWEFPGEITRIPEFCAPALGNKNNTVTIEADLPADASGVLYALGGFAGGVTCYLDDGYLCYEYNCFILSRTKIRSADQTAARPHHDRRGNPLCRAAARRTARHHHASRLRGHREGPGAGQRAAAVHRQRLPRHRCLPRLTGVAGLLRQGALPLQRPHRACPRRIHLTHRPARSHAEAAYFSVAADRSRACTAW